MSDREDPFLEGIAKNVRQLMRERDISSASLAERSGLSPQRVRRLMAGEVDPRAIELMSMAKALGVRPGVLIENLSLDETGEGGSDGD